MTNDQNAGGYSISDKTGNTAASGKKSANCTCSNCECTNCQCGTTAGGCDKTLLVGIALLALAIAFAGVMVFNGLKEFRSSDRTISVKGLAVKDVEADLAIWTIKHTATGNDLAFVQNTINENGSKIRAFLRANGLTDKDISGRRLEVSDLLAQAYRPQNADQSRFIISEVIAVRSPHVSGVEAAYQKSGDLLAQNVSLIVEQNQSPIEYIFTGLNAIKPEMIAEATKSAREAAEQFAKDSGAKIGTIKYASQGYFQILPRDSDNSFMERQVREKSVRVVTSINFDIRD